MDTPGCQNKDGSGYVPCNMCPIRNTDRCTQVIEAYSYVKIADKALIGKPTENPLPYEPE